MNQQLLEEIRIKVMQRFEENINTNPSLADSKSQKDLLWTIGFTASDIAKEMLIEYDKMRNEQ